MLLGLSRLDHPVRELIRAFEVFFVRLVREYFTRSRNHSLNVIFTFTSQEKFPAPTTQMVFVLISTASTPWETLELESRPSLTEPVARTAPVLRRFYPCSSGSAQLPPCPQYYDEGLDDEELKNEGVARRIGFVTIAGSEQLGTIDISSNTDYVLRNPRAPLLLPELRAAYSRNEHFFFFDPLLDMLGSRSWHGSALQTVSMPLPFDKGLIDGRLEALR
ncbi:hypothetical protein DFH09DRAFT_1302362 [Mycena vulgaris]|nr:hypothetical protein DFH09DRAFT_1302362 [Mycena vulgaris]